MADPTACAQVSFNKNTDPLPHLNGPLSDPSGAGKCLHCGHRYCFPGQPCDGCLMEVRVQRLERRWQADFAEHYVDEEGYA